jgi:hypothetical protein
MTELNAKCINANFIPAKSGDFYYFEGLDGRFDSWDLILEQMGQWRGSGLLFFWSKDCSYSEYTKGLWQLVQIRSLSGMKILY